MVFRQPFFASGALIKQALASSRILADALYVSPNYLSGLLKNLTGQSTQQHLHVKLIESR